ncbi:MAG: hypothetical protein ACJ758_07165 [Actinomycetota bacterium]
MALAFLLVLGGLLPAIGARADTPSGRTFVTMYSENGDYIGGGTSRAFFPFDGDIALTGTSSSLQANVNGGTSSTYFTFSFYAGSGRALHEGTYVASATGSATMDIFGDGRGCDAAGRFEILDIGFGPSGAVTRLNLLYEQHCDEGIPSLFGQIVYHEPAADATPFYAGSNRVWFPDAPARTNGAVANVYVVVPPSGQPVTFDDARVRGYDRPDFDVRVDACTGTTVEPGDLCQVIVRFTPQEPGPFTAYLKLLDDQGNTIRIPLDGFGIGGHTSVRLKSDGGDYVGQGQTETYAPADSMIPIDGTYHQIDGRITSDQDWWSFDFEAPSGDVLAPGSSYQATRYPFNGNGAGMDFSGNGRGCNELSGPFTINALNFFGNGTLKSLSIDFEQHCENMTPALHGRIRYRMPVGDSTPPGPVGDLTVTRSAWGGSASVSWTDPPSDFDHVLVRFLQGTLPTLPSSGELAYVGSGTSTHIAGLTRSKDLAVAVFPVDAAGNVGPRVTVQT